MYIWRSFYGRLLVHTVYVLLPHIVPAFAIEPNKYTVSSVLS